MTKHLAAATAILTALTTLTLTPAAQAADHTPGHPAAAPAGHAAYSAFAWANDDGAGYLSQPDTTTCYQLSPALVPGSIAANLTPHDAVLYTSGDCTGDSTATLPSGSLTTHTDENQGAHSVKFTREAPPEPEPLPQPEPSTPGTPDVPPAPAK